MKEIIKPVIRELETMRRCSLYQAIYDNNIDWKDNIAISYKRNQITFKKMFEKVDLFACALAMMGYGKGTELLVCMSNTPEFIYLLLASAKIGAKFNPIDTGFDRDYIEEIIRKNGTGRIFLTSDNYEPLKGILERSPDIEEIIVFSLSESLPFMGGIKHNPFESIDSNFKNFDNDIFEGSFSSTKKVLTQAEFFLEAEIACEERFDFDPIKDSWALRSTFKAEVDVEDEFLVTYSHGSKNDGRPMATTHSIKSLLLPMMLRETDSALKLNAGIKVYAHMPTYTFANISTNIIEALYLGWTVIPEPIHDLKYFSYGVVMNKPNVCIGNIEFWRYFCKNLEGSEYFKTLKIPYLSDPIVLNEVMGPGEERLFNKMAREHKFGADKPMFYSEVTRFKVIYGADATGNVFESDNLGEKNAQKLDALAYVDVDIIDKNGRSVEVGEYGEVIVYSECGATDREGTLEQDEESMRRADGRIWHRLGVYGVKLEEGFVQLKGRLKDTVLLSNSDGDEVEYPLFKINDIVASDTKNILSSCVVKVQDGDAIYIVVHFEPQKGADKKEPSEQMQIIQRRLDSEIPDVLKDSIFLRYRSPRESFSLNFSEQRDMNALEEEGITEAVSYRKIKEKERRIKYVPKASLTKNDK